MDRLSLRWSAALVGITFVWGSTFVVVKEAVDRLPVFAFNSWRFAIAAVIMAVIARRELRQLKRGDFIRGAALGALLWAGYAFQTLGLTRTTAAKAGFITGMFVVFTPLIQGVLIRTWPRASVWTGVALAAVGLALLTLDGSLTPSLGDALVLACALAFAFHIVGLGVWSPGRSAAALTAVQLGVAALLNTGGAIIEAATTTDSSPVWLPPDTYVWAAILFTAIFASALAFTVQTGAQAVLPPTRAAVIMTLEPVFAWVTEWLGVPVLIALGVTGLTAATFGLRDAFGAGFILLAMVIVEVVPTRPDDQIRFESADARVTSTPTAT